ncbi:galactokinase [Psychrosphaera sp. B3R10]|uniref:galactokinase n=1 Tax=unclassified Psychrosphaera TaxID=2641570 RepID=UPI001C09ACFA|nr:MULTISPECIES: galactokinase [unclassified Psychrosphaera]MBU2881751.1 galactokinase [Psychrosphaera sp. I2R16]MBU2990164.1 galactokinase [Psychrosphaera sp. B3R10]
MSQQTNLTEIFQQQYGYQPAVICHGPGRVNLIGDHTDYNDGFVLPAAINFGTNIAASTRDDQTVRVLAVDCDGESAEFSLTDIKFDEDKMWLNYVGGTLLALLKSNPEIKGADLVVTGNVPQGAGLSSSASFEIAILKTFSELYQLGLDGVKAALMGQQAENEFVGCNCGIMDQLISAMGKESNAMLLDCRSLTFKHAPIPQNMALVIINSNVKRGLVDSEYNTRRKQCEAVAAYFNKPALRDVSLAELEAAQSDIEPELYQRAKHVVTENDRTEAALVALQANDMATMSELMRNSHLSLKNDFAVTTPEMDYLVDIVHQVLGNKGGVRMTGGGFGGCVVALAPNELVDDIKATISELYQSQSGLVADVYVCVAKDGAFHSK